MFFTFFRAYRSTFIICRWRCRVHLIYKIMLNGRIFLYAILYLKNLFSYYTCSNKQTSSFPGCIGLGGFIVPQKMFLLKGNTPLENEQRIYCLQKIVSIFTKIRSGLKYFSIRFETYFKGKLLNLFGGP